MILVLGIDSLQRIVITTAVELCDRDQPNEWNAQAMRSRQRAA